MELHQESMSVVACGGHALLALSSMEEDRGEACW